ncbi:hypothetical protein M0802_001023 [Mischocyttarus mexicanus]|nr:hypothetical protein M0802_001023 [Mischocyttarus mexicanus]
MQCKCASSFEATLRDQMRISTRLHEDDRETAAAAAAAQTYAWYLAEIRLVMPQRPVSAALNAVKLFDGIAITPNRS